jgi:hypothetical protein
VVVEAAERKIPDPVPESLAAEDADSLERSH